MNSGMSPAGRNPENTKNPYSALECLNQPREIGNARNTPRIRVMTSGMTAYSRLFTISVEKSPSLQASLKLDIVQERGSPVGLFRNSVLVLNACSAR